MRELLEKLLLIVCLAGMPWMASAQELADRKVTISVKDAVARTAIAQLRASGSALFAFEESTIDRTKRVTLSYKDARLETVVKDLCKQLDIKYVFRKNMVLLIPKNVNPISVSDWVSLQGSVLDENGEPMVGVTVFGPMGNVGTVTDVEGKFRLRLKEQELLTFNFIGYDSQTYTVTASLASKPMIVRLEPNSNSLEEVVVNGYQAINKGRYVGAISQVNMDEARITGELTIDQMLQGAVPGISVQMSSGQVGASAKVRVRGTSTLLGNQEPLWVVDGIIQYDPFPMQEGDNALAADADNLKLIAGNCISWLNPNDIESLTVLKDASATAIYGSKAANGVIVITTKKAQPGKMTVSYNGSLTIGQKPSYGLYDLMNSQEKMQLSKEIYDEKLKYVSDTTPIGYQQLLEKLMSKQITYDEYVELFRKYEYQNTDWFDLLFRTSVSHSHGVTLSGGSKNVMNRISLNYSENIGESKGNDVKSYSFNSNTTFRMGDRVTLSIGLNGSNREATGYAYGVNPFTYASNTARTIPAYNEDGTYYYHAKRSSMPDQVFYRSGNKFFGYNILNEMENTGSKTGTRKLAANMDLNVKLLKGLEFHGVYSYSISSSEQRQWAGERSFYIAQIRDYDYGDSRVLPGSSEEKSSFLPHGGLLDTQSMTSRSYTFRNSLVYNTLLKETHNLTFNIGIEATSDRNQGFKSLRYGYLPDRGQRFASVTPPPYRFAGSQTITEATANKLLEEMRNGSKNTDQENNFLSEYLTAVYSYDSRYVLNLNARMDASNRFGQDEKKKFRPAWSVGAKWHVANEPFLMKQNLINILDLSGSYGYQGNAVETVSPYLIAVDNGLAYTGQYSLGIASLPYPDLGWEKTRSWNIGIDLSVLKGRVSFGTNIFGKNSDVLNGQKIAAENGVTSAPVFGTKMRNYGYELSLSLIPVRTKDFTWTLSMNTGVTHNKVSQQNIVYTLEDYLNGTALLDGVPYSTIWSFEFNGLDPENGKPLFKNMEIATTEDYTKFLVNSGTLQPDFTGGIFTRFSYKGWSLQGNFSVSLGGKKRLPNFYNTAQADYGLPQPEENNSRRLMNRWRQPGDEEHTIYPSLPDRDKSQEYVYLPTSTADGRNPYWAYNYSDIRVAKSDFIRCRQISVEYRFQQQMLKRMGMSNLSLTASLTNPFLITFDKKWEGYDPETGGWPARKTFSMTLNASF